VPIGELAELLLAHPRHVGRLTEVLVGLAQGGEDRRGVRGPLQGLGEQRPAAAVLAQRDEVRQRPLVRRLDGQRLRKRVDRLLGRVLDDLRAVLAGRRPIAGPLADLEQQGQALTVVAQQR